MEITRELLKAIRPEIDAALAEVAKRHGLKSLNSGKCSFTPGNFSMKLEGVAEGALDKDAARYTSTSAAFLELPPLGSAFKSSGRTYKTVGLNTTGSKVICERDDGKRFLFAVEACKALVATQAGKPS